MLSAGFVPLLQAAYVTCRIKMGDGLSNKETSLCNCFDCATTIYNNNNDDVHKGKTVIARSL